MRLSVFLLLPSLIWSLGGPGCNRQRPALPRSLQGEVEAAELPMRLALELVAAGRPPYRYRNLGGERAGTTEQQWTRIDSVGPGRYRSLEVYNVYEYPDGKQREFFLLLFTLDLSDTTQRVPVQDLRFRASADTAYYTDRDDQELRLQGGGPLPLPDGLPIYALEGYAHAGDPDPGYLRFWSPQAGSVLSWYGRDEIFALEATGDPALDMALPALISALQARLGLGE